MIQEVKSTSDILNKNTKCIFCNSTLSLSAEIALSKVNQSFEIKDNLLCFKYDPNYFSLAQINLDTDEFQIERTNRSAYYINYKSVNFIRKCYYCNNDFFIKYGKYKFESIEGKQTSFGKPEIDYVSFKLIDQDNKNIYYVINNYSYNESKIIHLTYVENYILQVKTELKFDSRINFNYSDKDQIKNKIESLLLFI